MIQMQPHIRLTDVEMIFSRPDGEGENIHALGPVNLDLHHGEFFAVVGPSGCGKSTLLELMIGLTTPTRGNITFEGQPIRGSCPDGIGVVFQEDASFPWLTVRDNIAFGLRRMNLDRQEQESRIEKALTMMGLEDFHNVYPRLILLDEPFGALDQQTRLLMGDEVLSLWRKTGATIFLITHALDEAAMLADRIGVMSSRPGKLIDVITTNWPRDRDSKIVEQEEFGHITSRLWRSLRAESMKAIGKKHVAS